jgi:hypothetical protein
MRPKIEQHQIVSNDFPIVMQVNQGDYIYFHSVSGITSLLIHDVLIHGLPPLIHRHYFGYRIGQRKNKYAKIVAIFKPKKITK